MNPSSLINRCNADHVCPYYSKAELKRNNKLFIIALSLFFFFATVPICCVRALLHVCHKCLRAGSHLRAGVTLKKKKKLECAAACGAALQRLEFGCIQCRCLQCGDRSGLGEVGGGKTPALALDLSLDDCGWKGWEEGEEGSGADCGVDSKK